MEEVRIKVRINGPYRIEGPMILEDADGNSFQLPEGWFALCRCGGSTNNPFFAVSHRELVFRA